MVDAGVRPMQSPIPQARKNDPEDVAWALSTAQTMWGRGDRMEAAKWLRRAAEAASEADDDTRALELAKAASDVSALLSTPPPPPSIPPPRPSSAPRPSAAPRPAAGSPARPVPKPAPSKPARAKSPSAPSRDERKSHRKSLSGETHAPRGSSKSTSHRARSASRPDPSEEHTDTHEMILDRKPAKADPGETSRVNAQEADAWPTEVNADVPVFGTERTRIGAPAYQAGPKKTQADDTGDTAESAAPVRTSQAVRVVVWRGPDGVRIAPAGTVVSAITVEAVLVSLDPDIDLLPWLTGE